MIDLDKVRSTLSMPELMVKLGMGDQAKGAAKDAAGKILGDSKLQAEGKADKMKGKIENAVGGAKDTVRDAFNK